MNARQRAMSFCERFGLAVPVVQAPMAGSSPPELAAAVAGAGGMGAFGALRDSPEGIARWMERFRAASSGAVQINVWIPETEADTGERRGRTDEAEAFLRRMGEPGEAPRARPPAFPEQCEAMLEARPTVVSSIMGVFEPDYVRRFHERGIAWFACATTLDEARAAQDAGADAVVAQGMEAGGHQGSFDQERAGRSPVGLVALLPWFADHLEVPVVAAGGIADGRGLAAALALGASAVQVGTALLRCPETGISPQWAAHLEGLPPEATVTTEAYTGRLARAVSTPYLEAWNEPGAPRPARYPDQLRLVTRWRGNAGSGVDPGNHWAGQGAFLAADRPAGEVVSAMWQDASGLLA